MADAISVHRHQKPNLTLTAADDMCVEVVSICADQSVSICSSDMLTWLLSLLTAAESFSHEAIPTHPSPTHTAIQATEADLMLINELVWVGT